MSKGFFATSEPIQYIHVVWLYTHSSISGIVFLYMLACESPSLWFVLKSFLWKNVFDFKVYMAQFYKKIDMYKKGRPD